MRENIIYRCTECGEENYINTKNKRNHPERMEINKYCPRCNKKLFIRKRNKPLGFFSLLEH
ncbi:50S ribosomal protein L33 [Coprobacillaceae bacterium CR2/5/TPMF4]|nr:50S ribosomal protein L33 [Coprobacillaceae bacterium CR2/5/TPMF4]